jgi:hypothetical protein
MAPRGKRSAKLYFLIRKGSESRHFNFERIVNDPLSLGDGEASADCADTFSWVSLGSAGCEPAGRGQLADDREVVLPQNCVRQPVDPLINHRGYRGLFFRKRDMRFSRPKS